MIENWLKTDNEESA